MGPKCHYTCPYKRKSERVTEGRRDGGTDGWPDPDGRRHRRGGDRKGVDRITEAEIREI